MGDLNDQGLTFRWLGTAGLAFQAGGRGLLVDPFFTRPPARALLTFARVSPDPALVARHTPPADYLLITHAHYDHLLDAPEVLRLTGARAYGSTNACALLRLHGLPESRLACVRPGDRLALGPFAVEVFPAYHIPTPIDRWINGPLPKRLTGGQARPPLRLIDYRMDACLAFRIQAGGQAVLVGSHPAPAGVYFAIPYLPEKRMNSILRAVNPRQVVLIHWDDFTRPLTRPLRPTLVIRRGRLPFGRIDLDASIRQVRSILPGTQVTVPELFREYRLESMM